MKKYKEFINESNNFDSILANMLKADLEEEGFKVNANLLSLTGVFRKFRSINADDIGNEYIMIELYFKDEAPNEEYLSIVIDEYLKHYKIAYNDTYAGTLATSVLLYFEESKNSNSIIYKSIKGINKYNL